MVRDSKIEKIVADNAFRTGERFQLVQPLAVHGGTMPKEVLSVEAGPWNERGRRSFRHQLAVIFSSLPVASRSRLIRCR